MTVEGEYTWNKPAEKIEALMKRAVRHKEIVTIPAYPSDVVFRAEGAIKSRILTTYYGRTLDGELLVSVRPTGEFGSGAPYISVTT